MRIHVYENVTFKCRFLLNRDDCMSMSDCLEERKIRCHFRKELYTKTSMIYIRYNKPVTIHETLTANINFISSITKY